MPTAAVLSTGTELTRGELFPEADNRRFGIVVQSLLTAGATEPAPIAVERASYWSLPGEYWAAGTSVMGRRLR